MTANYKAGAIWKKSTPYVNVGGTWKIAKSAWTNLSAEWKSWFLQGGLNDGGFTVFDKYNGPESNVISVAIQTDGKILLSGYFTAFNGVTANYVVRLNPDGTGDTAFIANIGTGAQTDVVSIAVQTDGKILLGGLFTSFNGTSVSRIVRLNSDGTTDTAFATNIGTGASSTIFTVALQSDGKILLGGNFTTFNGTTANRIVRLNSNGTVDTGFTTGTGASGTVNSIAVQSDGKILLGGAFSTFRGLSASRIVRLNSNGTTDTVFSTNTGTAANVTVFTIAVQGDGKILLGGSFATFNGVTVNRIVRLNSDGTRDTAFTTNAGTGANNTVNSIAVQTDGKILLCGAFSTFNGVTVNYIVRLNSDGTIDTTFTTNAGTGASSTANFVMVQSDGKILLSGGFITFNNVTVNRIVRLNSSGTRDTGFANNTGTGASGLVISIAVQSDGKILIGGGFITFNSVTVNRIMRLNIDGTPDTAFSTNTGTGASNTVNNIVIQSDGKILVGGSFIIFNGVTARIVRLNSDGTRDTVFTTNTGTGASDSINSIAVQSDGKILLGGAFVTFNGVTVNRIVRLSSNGTPDTAFTTNTGTGTNGTVSSIVVQTDGKILLGGAYNTFNGTTANRIVRLNSDGTADTAFNTNTGTGANGSVSLIAIQSDGKILLGGDFTTFNGTTVNRIVRLNSSGTIDTAFTTNTGTGANLLVNSVVVQSDSKILIGGTFTTFNNVTLNRIVRLNSSGTIDTAFTTNTGTGAIGTVSSIAIQGDEKILLGGNFTGFNNITRTRLARIGGDIAQ